MMTGPTKKMVGIILALAVIGILAGLSFFNASQQKGLNNTIGIAIIILPIVIILWLVSSISHRSGGMRRRFRYFEFNAKLMFLLRFVVVRCERVLVVVVWYWRFV